MASPPVIARARARAREAASELECRGVEYNVSEMFELTLAKCCDLSEEALIGLVAGAVAIVDKENTQKRGGKSKQKFLFDMGGSFALGENSRIGKPHARREHVLVVLQLSDANLEAARIANEELHEEFNKLDPYLSSGLKLGDAVEAYSADNPEDELPE